jgi:hypothetical protein
MFFSKTHYSLNNRLLLRAGACVGLQAILS